MNEYAHESIQVEDQNYLETKLVGVVHDCRESRSCKRISLYG